MTEREERQIYPPKIKYQKRCFFSLFWGVSAEKRKKKKKTKLENSLRLIKNNQLLANICFISCFLMKIKLWYDDHRVLSARGFWAITIH